MRKFLSVLLLALGFTAMAGAEPRLRIGVEMGDKPISFVDAQGQPTGFTAALLAEMKHAGLGEVEIVAKSWSRLLEDFQSGQINVLANVARTDDRLRDMDFSISHAHVHGLVYNRADQPPLRTTADFAGKKIAALPGSISFSNALAHGGWGATLMPITDPQAGLDALARGDYDAVLLVYGLEAKFIRNSHGLRREFVDDIIHEFRFAVHKGDATTLARLNDALAKVRHNGTFDRLYDEWIGPIEPHPIRLSDLRPYAAPLILGALAIASIIWWQRRVLAHISLHAQALRESEERFHRLVDAAFEGWVIHRDGLVALANPSFAKTFGFTSEELVGHSVLDLTAPESRAKLADAIKTGRTDAYEVLGLRKDGTFIPVEIAGQPCTFHGQPARIAAVRDLTAKKAAAADQLILSKLESTGILAGGIAHDFNNLLATMVLSIDLALLTQQHSEAGLRYLGTVKEAVTSAKKLTQQLITFARGGASVRQPTDLRSLIEQIVPLTLSGSNVRGEVITSSDLWTADIDAGQIERVVSNLVLNAREAMPGGGIVTVRVENQRLHANEVAALPAGDYLRIDIVDHGHGIPAETLPKIFDPYFSTKQRGTQKGMGLGLTICHTIVHQHGGALSVHSQADTGTTIRVYLPATQQPAIRIASVLATSERKFGRVLVMDDEDGLRETMSLALTHEGYVVELAADGDAALKMYATAQQSGQPFDVVVLDLTVRGGMGGLAAIKALRVVNPAVKAVVMSGYAQEAVLRDYAQHGFCGALTKPFDIATLTQAVARAIAYAPN